jgi:hypothetical protein
MATSQGEILRTLDDGLVVAWDTTDVSREVRREFRDAAQRQIDMIVNTLDEGGQEHLTVVELKTEGRGTGILDAQGALQRRSYRPRQAAKGRRASGKREPKGRRRRRSSR